MTAQIQQKLFNHIASGPLRPRSIVCTASHEAIDEDHIEREMAALLKPLNDAMTIVRELKPYVTNEALEGSLRDIEAGLTDMLADANYWHSLAEALNAKRVTP